jgi:hypothetical protein
MRTYADSVVNKFATDTTGNAGAGALITVYVAGSTVKAPLFDVLGAAITNPLAADDEGNYSFKVADGTYDLVINEGALSETRIDRLQIAEIVGFNADTAHYSDLVTAQAANLTVSTIITTAGYYSINDGGGGQYVVVAGGTGAVDGGQYVNMLNGNQLELILTTDNDIRKWGVVGDNVTDDTTAFEAALNSRLKLTAANLHLKLTKLSGFEFFDDLNFSNTTLDFSSIGTNVFRTLMKTQGTQISETVMGDVLSGERYVTYNGTYEVGDLIVIHNAENAFNANPAEGILKGELFEIISGTGAAIQLNRAVLLDLTASTGTVYRPTTANITGINFIGNGFDITENNETAINISFGKDNIVEDIKTIHVEHYSLHLESTLRTTATQNSFKHDQPTDAEAQLIQNAGKVVYAIAIFNATSEMNCHNNIIEGGKHQVDFTQNSTYPGYGVFNSVHNNLLFSCWHASIATHDANTETMVSNNVIYDVMRGIEFRTPNNYAYNNIIRATRLRGVSGGEAINLTEDFSGCVIDGNSVDGRTWCIRTNLGVSSSGVKITNNTLSQVGGAHSAIDFDTQVTDSIISGNSAVGDAFSATALIKSSVTLEGCVIENNTSKGVIADVDATGSKISANTRLGDGLCLQISVGNDNIINNNTSQSGNVVSAVGNKQRGNYSSTTLNGSIRSIGGNFAVDVFDTYINVTRGTDTVINRIFTNIFNGIFVFNLDEGSVSITHDVSEPDSIRTLTGTNYTWNAGTPLILCKTDVGFFQVQTV